MARKKRCNLCGAKLKGNICHECGYNNAAYDYKVNEAGDYCSHSSSETFYDEKDHADHSEPVDSWDYSHIEELLEKDYGSKEAKTSNEAATPNEAPVTYGLNKERPKKKKRKIKWLKWVIIIWLLPTIFELVAGLIYSVQKSVITEQVKVRVEQKPEIMPEVTPEVTEEEELSQAEEAFDLNGAGGAYKATLSQGIYMAGLHLPIGVYDAQLISGHGTVYIRNMETNYWESNYLYENSSEREKKLKKLELSAGTQIKIMDEMVMEFATENNQGYFAERMAQKELSPIALADGMVAGEHFEEGTYHVVCKAIDDGMGFLVRKYDNYFGEEELEQIMFTEENKRFENLTLEEGDMLLTLNCEVMFQPAEYGLLGQEVAW